MRTGSFAELVALADMPSGPSLQRFIASRADFPVIERGGYGKAYAFDLDAAAAFVRAHWRDGRRLSPSDARLAQLPLDLGDTA